MSKLAEKAKGSKLRQHLQEQKNKIDDNERVTRKIKQKDYPRSYRIDAEVMNILKGTLARINENSHKKVTEARLIKALIFLSQKLDDDEIMNAVKEVW